VTFIKHQLILCALSRIPSTNSRCYFSHVIMHIVLLKTTCLVTALFNFKTNTQTWQIQENKLTTNITKT